METYKSMDNKGIQVKLDIEAFKKLQEEYPTITQIVDSGYLRKYQFVNMLRTTTVEADEVIMRLLSCGVVKQTPHGYKMTNIVKNILISKGVTF